MAKAILLTDPVSPPPALVRAGLEVLPVIIRTQGERASRRFIEFFTASIRNRNTPMAYARAVNQFFDWCEDRRLRLVDIEAISVATLLRPHRRTGVSPQRCHQHIRRSAAHS